MTNKIVKSIREGLTADCSKCFGLCCTALNIIASNDFPINKPADTPCMNLQSDYSCQIHSQLRENGFKGCTVFDCLGAGQVVSQVTFNSQSWRDNPEIGRKMFRVFPIMGQIHEMIAYAAEAFSYDIPIALSDKLSEKLKSLQNLTKLAADELLSLDLMTYRLGLNELLTAASDFIRENTIANLPGAKRLKDFDHTRANWMGKKLKDKDLRATDFRGAYLIAADMRNTDLRAVNFIGADLRDTDFSRANLSTSMYLTQMQINSAKGDVKTLLPSHIQRPSHWIN
ncbi:pentapeptide repeat-containing protein [Lysinibacillus sp. BW-2-10]|uniref:pentapeptide repeat-containing protein n=1 Tax=Lysinibacillus sp. BW-2-10 TaxID=2590030 RepID=UPI00117EC245|nr:pentapeptide repeat-containing protein [Lysinibacillus sp. BW-2-10]TSI11257.1 pentapeptide repeat-containing protein [Lysinibacillus sp. BW-2-10]